MRSARPIVRGQAKKRAALNVFGERTAENLLCSTTRALSRRPKIFLPTNGTPSKEDFSRVPRPDRNGVCA